MLDQDLLIFSHILSHFLTFVSHSCQGGLVGRISAVLDILFCPWQLNPCCSVLLSVVLNGVFATQFNCVGIHKTENQ